MMMTLLSVTARKDDRGHLLLLAVLAFIALC